jgi:hypothetical protein
MSFENGFSPIEQEPSNKKEVFGSVSQNENSGVWDKFKKSLMGVVGASVVAGGEMETDAGIFNKHKNVDPIKPVAVEQKAESFVKVGDHLKEISNFSAEIKSSLSDIKGKTPDIALFLAIKAKTETLSRELSLVDLKKVSPRERMVWNSTVEDLKKTLVTVGGIVRQVGQGIWREIEVKGLNGVKPEDRVKIAPIRDEANKWFEIQEDLERLSKNLPAFSRFDAEQGGLVK